MEYGHAGFDGPLGGDGCATYAGTILPSACLRAYAISIGARETKFLLSGYTLNDYEWAFMGWGELDATHALRSNENKTGRISTC